MFLLLTDAKLSYHNNQCIYFKLKVTNSDLEETKLAFIKDGKMPSTT